MNAYQQNLYNELLALTVDGDVFYFQDFNLDGKIYRIFNYRLASYTEFLKKSALECRGHMFEVDAANKALRLVSMPPQKFFNLAENPSTMGLDLSTVDTVELKADGSLMSTYTHGDVSNAHLFESPNLRVKSKGSLFSEQAIDAMKWLALPENANFKKDLNLLEQVGYTVNMEWCAPHNRIVIGYVKPHLQVLNARHRETGQYLDRDRLEFYMGQDRVIDRPELGGKDVATFVQSIPGMLDDIEGYVCRIGDLWFKVKTEKYMSLHHAKDSINNPRRLFEAIVDEGIDDLRSMFSTDATAIMIIDQMQEKVNHLYNGMVKEVEAFYAKHKNDDRKTFALAGRDKSQLTQMYFALAMNLYLQKPVDYKQWMKNHYKELGFKDTSVNSDV